MFLPKIYNIKNSIAKFKLIKNGRLNSIYIYIYRYKYSYSNHKMTLTHWI